MTISSGYLIGSDRALAIEKIKRHHYTSSVSTGKSHVVSFGDAIVIWAIPANYNLPRFFGDKSLVVWELSRLWAPDGHSKNLLTQAIKHAISTLKQLEPVDLIVSYADPNAGHKGGVYRAASWIYHGQSEESRSYRCPEGRIVARRAFHSGGRAMKKAEIEALGYTQIKTSGKHRFVKPLSRKAKKLMKKDGASQ